MYAANAALDLAQLDFVGNLPQPLQPGPRMVEAPLPCPAKEFAELRALELLLQLEVEDEPYEQFGLGFPLNDFAWTDEEVLQIRTSLPERHAHLLRDERTRDSWLEILLWLIAPFESLDRCPPFSLQACCEAYGANFHTVRECVVEWIAAPLKLPGRAKEGTFQTQCEVREQDAHALREKLLRRFEPARLKTLR